jgi:FG-GAP repeat protein
MSAVRKATGCQKRPPLSVSLLGVICVAAALVIVYAPVAAATTTPAVVLHPRSVLFSPNPTFGGYFGISVADSGNNIVLGAYGEGGDAGHAYLYNDQSHTFTMLSSRNPDTCSPVPCNGGLFGGSVAVAGHFVLVGADAEPLVVGNQTLYYTGHAYIYNSATQAYTTLTSPNPTNYGFFGWSVAVSPKYAVVGAPDESPGGLYQAGQVYVFSSTTGVLLATLTSPNVQVDGQFGYSVAVNGNLIIVGAPTETASGYAYAGHAYIFNLARGTTLMLTNPNAANNTDPNAFYYGDFGSTVAVDSYNTIVVGAWEDAVSGISEAGHAYTFNAVNGRLIHTLISPNAQIDGWFGASVSINIYHVLVGAYGESVNGVMEAGHAYAFQSARGGLTDILASPNPQPGGIFGWGLAAVGTGAVVGAGNETADSLAGAGDAYLFASV